VVTQMLTMDCFCVQSSEAANGGVVFCKLTILHLPGSLI